MEEMTYDKAIKEWRDGLGGFAQRTNTNDVNDVKCAMNLIKERVDTLSQISEESINSGYLMELNHLIYLYQAAKIVWEKQEEGRRILKDRFSKSIQEFYSICVK